MNLRLDYLLLFGLLPNCFRCLCVLSFSCFFCVKFPLSPSVVVYRFPLAAILSIAHRVTGVLLFLYITSFSWYLFTSFFASSSFFHIFLNFFFSGCAAQFLLIFFVLFFCYHLCSGLRHLFWDLSMGFSPFFVKFSNILVIVAALLLFSFVIFSVFS